MCRKYLLKMRIHPAIEFATHPGKQPRVAQLAAGVGPGSIPSQNWKGRFAGITVSSGLAKHSNFVSIDVTHVHFMVKHSKTKTKLVQLCFHPSHFNIWMNPMWSIVFCRKAHPFGSRSLPPVAAVVKSPVSWTSLTRFFLHRTHICHSDLLILT